MGLQAIAGKLHLTRRCLFEVRVGRQCRVDRLERPLVPEPTAVAYGSPQIPVDMFLAGLLETRGMPSVHKTHFPQVLDRGIVLILNTAKGHIAFASHVNAFEGT